MIVQINASVVSADEIVFDNEFAGKTHDHKTGTSKRPHGHSNKDQLPHHSIPKMQFPMFDGTSPKIWIDSCYNYFTIYNIIESLKVTAAVMHLEGNAAKWWQAYKQNHSVPTWQPFCSIILEKFGADDFRQALNDLLSLKQTRTVEEYTAAFQSL